MNLFRCFIGTGIEPYVLHRESSDVIRHSRYYKMGELIPDPAENPEAFLPSLIDLAKRLRGKPVIFNCNDGILLLISRNREQLQEFYQFLMPPPDMVEGFVYKTRFHQLAKHYGLPVPETILSSEIRNTEDVIRQLVFPCVFKPDSRHHGWNQSALLRKEAGAPQKMLRADTAEEFRRLLPSIREFTDNFVVQNYIPGGEDSNYSFHAYFNRHSEPLGYFVGRKIRTYPKDGGISTYLELVKEPEVERIGLEILRKLNFVGPVKLDFRKEVRDERFYLLEVNSRNTLWNYLGAVCGINIPLITWADLKGENCKLQAEYKTGVRWLSFHNDFRAFLRSYHPDNDLSWMQWVYSYKGPKIYDFFAWDDPLPWLFHVFALFRNLLSSLREKIRRSPLRKFRRHLITNKRNEK